MTITHFRQQKFFSDKQMLALQKQSKFIEKKVQLPNGAWALVVFEVTEVGGKFVAEAVSGHLIENTVAKAEVLALPVFIDIQNIAPIESPFFANIEELIKDLSFITTQPTRGPDIV